MTGGFGLGFCYTIVMKAILIALGLFVLLAIANSFFGGNPFG